MNESKKMTAVCPYCKAGLTEVCCEDIPARWHGERYENAGKLIVAHERAKQEKHAAENPKQLRISAVAIFACPHCKTMLGAVGNIMNNSYIGAVNIKSDPMA